MNPSSPLRFVAAGLLGSLLTCLAAAAPAALLVKNGLFITMKPGQEEPFVGYMTVDSNGRIAAIAPGAPPATITADQTLDAAGKMIAPGFISAHSHLAFSPLRGVGHAETLYGWIRASTRFLKFTTAEDLYWFTLHGSLDFVRCGITTAYDFTTGGSVAVASTAGALSSPAPILKAGRHEEEQMRAKADAGMRFVNSVGMPRVGTPDDQLARLGALIAHAEKTYGKNPLFLKMAISGGVQRAPSKETAYLEARAMKQFGLINQSHFLESPELIPEQQAKFSWYEEAGALGPNFIFGHFIQTTPDIVMRAAKAGASMSWQPASNSRLASGVADIPQYRAFGMKIGVGLDNQNCTDNSDPFSNLRTGLSIVRAKYKDAKALHVRDMLHFHTLGSAEILQIADKVGSLEPGKFADFLVVDPRHPDTGPVHDPIATYVLACGLRNLKQVYIGGKLAADGSRILTFDEPRAMAEVYARVAKIQKFIDAEEGRTGSSTAASAQPPHPFALATAATRPASTP